MALLRESLFGQARSHHRGDRGAPAPSSWRVSTIATTVFLGATLWSLLRNRGLPGFDAGLLLGLIFPCFYALALFVGPYQSGLGGVVTAISAVTGFVAVGHAFWIALVTVAPGLPVARAQVNGAGSTIAVAPEYRGNVVVRLQGVLKPEHDAALWVTLDGISPPIVKMIVAPRRDVKIGMGATHAREPRFSVNVPTAIPEGVRALQIVRLEGALQGSLSVEVFPDRLPKDRSALLAAVGMLVAVLLQGVTGARGFAALTGAALGFGVSIVYRTGPAPDVQKLFAPLAFGGGAGAVLGVTGAAVVNWVLHAASRRRRLMGRRP